MAQQLKKMFAGKARQPPFNPGTGRKVKGEGTPQRRPLTSAHAHQFLRRHTSNNFEKQIQNNLILSSWILPFSLKISLPFLPPPQLYTNIRHFMFKRQCFLYCTSLTAQNTDRWNGMFSISCDPKMLPLLFLPWYSSPDILNTLSFLNGHRKKRN